MYPLIDGCHVTIIDERWFYLLKIFPLKIKIQILSWGNFFEFSRKYFQFQTTFNLIYIFTERRSEATRIRIYFFFQKKEKGSRLIEGEQLSEPTMEKQPSLAPPSQSSSRELQCVGRLEIVQPKPVGFLCGSIPVPTDKSFHDAAFNSALVPSSDT